MEELPQENKEEVAVISNESGAGQKRDSRYDERERNHIVSSVMTWPSHLIFAIFTIYVIYLCVQDYSLFALHPAFMTIGSIFLMAEAVMTMSPDSLWGSKLGHQGRVRLHWILQAGAAAFIFAGFLIIVILKNMNNKKHFQSWHAVLGLISFICVGITSSGGVIALYSLSLKKFIKPGKMKLLHILAGIVTFAIGILSEVFGLYTHWFPKNSSPTAQVICTVFIALGTIFALEGALKSAYSRFKALYQSI